MYTCTVLPYLYCSDRLGTLSSAYHLTLNWCIRIRRYKTHCVKGLDLRTHTRTLSLSLSLAHTYTLSLSHTHTLSLSLSLSHTHRRARAHTQTRACSLSHSLSLALIYQVASCEQKGLSVLADNLARPPGFRQPLHVHWERFTGSWALVAHWTTHNPALTVTGQWDVQFCNCQCWY